MSETFRRLSDEEIARYHEDGFLVVRRFFDPDEVAPIVDVCEQDPQFGGAAQPYATRGTPTSVVSWNEFDDDSLFGLLPRLERMADAVTRLQGTEMYNYHSLLVRKGPHQKSKFSWHTGYGGFYYDGILFPEMLTCFVAVTDHTRSNGCTRMIRGSHKMGRLDHMLVDGEVVAHPERMPAILERMEVVDIEMDQGDVVFLDDCTLHDSGPNTTHGTRINMVLRYNAAFNEPFDLETQAAHRYRPLVPVADDALRARRYTSVYAPDNLWWGYRPEGVGKFGESGAHS